MFRLTRVAKFSAAHNFWLPDRSAEENRRLFGPAAREGPHGHNYRVEVTIAGEIDPALGMVVNISDLEAVLDRVVVKKLEATWLNRDIAYFNATVPTLENLAVYLVGKLEPEIPTGRVDTIRLYEMDDFYVDYHPHRGDDAMLFVRKYDFCASHRLHSAAISDEENRRLFGKCNNLHGHGHNYTLEVAVTGQIDPVTGMLVDLVKMDNVVNERVIEYLDHKNLNVEISEFQDWVPTTENVTRVVWQRLVDHLPAKLARVTVQETPNNFFEYMGD